VKENVSLVGGQNEDAVMKEEFTSRKAGNLTGWAGWADINVAVNQLNGYAMEMMHKSERLLTTNITRGEHALFSKWETFMRQFDTTNIDERNPEANALIIDIAKQIVNLIKEDGSYFNFMVGQLF